MSFHAHFTCCAGDDANTDSSSKASFSAENLLFPPDSAKSTNKAPSDISAYKDGDGASAKTDINNYSSQPTTASGQESYVLPGLPNPITMNTEGLENWLMPSSKTNVESKEPNESPSTANAMQKGNVAEESEDDENYEALKQKLAKPAESQGEGEDSSDDNGEKDPGIGGSSSEEDNY